MKILRFFFNFCKVGEYLFRLELSSIFGSICLTKILQAEGIISFYYCYKGCYIKPGYNDIDIIFWLSCVWCRQEASEALCERSEQKNFGDHALKSTFCNRLKKMHNFLCLTYCFHKPETSRAPLNLKAPAVPVAPAHLY